MKKRFLVGLTIGFLMFGIVGMVNAQTFIEDFEAPFESWESDWLGTYTNLENYYVATNSGGTSYRGNNPDGLWLDDGDGLYGLDIATIIFDTAFGSNLTALEIDIAGHVSIRLQVFDMSNNSILDIPVALTSGTGSDPGVYSHYVATSTNGISRFSFIPTQGSQVEGNTGIDNVIVRTDGAPVPVPSTIFLLASGLVGLAGVARKKMKK